VSVLVCVCVCVCDLRARQTHQDTCPSSAVLSANDRERSLCFSVLQRVAVCCSVLQRVAVCCNVLYKITKTHGHDLLC